MNASVAGNITGAYRGRIPLNVTLHSWPIPKLDTNLKQINETNYVIDKNSESAKNYTNSLHNLNATGYVAIEDDLTDTGLTDVQTFILAGVATVIPLLIIVVTILGVRFLWRRYKANKEDGYEGVLQKEESSEPLGKHRSFSLTLELKASESQMTMTQGEEITSAASTQLPTPKSNGNVITMTLKNNHLIVETEENIGNEGVGIESKGTTTKFVTSNTTDFGLQLQTQGATDFNKSFALERDGNSYNIPSSSDHGALVHSAPEETDYELESGNCNTGLSQSDLSVSSSESQNPNYRYGNQTGYDSGGYGYPEYSGYSMVSAENTSRTGPISHKIYIRGNSIIEQADAYLLNSRGEEHKLLKDILMSDIQAREKREYDIQCEEQNVSRNTSNSRTTEILPLGNPSPNESTTDQENEDPQVTHIKNENFQTQENNYLTNNGSIDKENRKS